MRLRKILLLGPPASAWPLRSRPHRLKAAHHPLTARSRDTPGRLSRERTYDESRDLPERSAATMAQTIVGCFDSQRDAQEAAQDVIAMGIDRSRVHLSTEGNSGAIASGAGDKGF